MKLTKGFGFVEPMWACGAHKEPERKNWHLLEQVFCYFTWIDVLNHVCMWCSQVPEDHQISYTNSCQLPCWCWESMSHLLSLFLPLGVEVYGPCLLFFHVSARDSNCLSYNVLNHFPFRCKSRVYVFMYFICIGACMGGGRCFVINS